MSAPALYNLASEYRALAMFLADGDFDLDTISDTIEASGLPDAISEKAQGCEMVARTMEADIPTIDAEIKRLQDLKKARQARADALRKYVLDNMLACNIERIDAPLFSIKVAKNPPKVEIFDERQLPADYLTDPPPPAPVPDKRLMLQALKDGAEIPGAKLTQGFRLAVK
ncbi:siphovirus Gp157 family protein [Pusillimonas noertemannii]|uniref:Viral Gp157 protein n=1 Tax=Pusillimonas noertemannii TaxID=305977 RepID=A0A2U1CS03_9BURK|nr:siphovirus Gp157 family protein [Pusillimonas noertemannii]NYT67933.1 siphovirus Gp157 family protein [Pusillimonas noertemannii]PVY68604.1 viral Gp157 protein [Pusillimonas noertemannii]TFL11924.1 siphovirus Gp157 family protein [Pusillimonas noertemannii]